MIELRQMIRVCKRHGKEGCISALEAIARREKVPRTTRNYAKNVATAVLLREWQSVVTKNNGWFDQHAAELASDRRYRGQHVLIRRYQIIGSAPTVDELTRMLYAMQRKRGRFISVIRLVLSCLVLSCLISA
jgi:hypothetical protein